MGRTLKWLRPPEIGRVTEIASVKSTQPGIPETAMARRAKAAASIVGTVLIRWVPPLNARVARLVACIGRGVGIAVRVAGLLGALLLVADTFVIASFGHDLALSLTR